MFTGIYATITYIVIGGVLLFLLARKAGGPKKCEVCGTDTKEYYTDANDKGTYLCRNHLVERWKKDFISASAQMMVIEPDFENYPYGYLYASPETLKKWQYSKAVVERVREILAAISGKNCATCGMGATIAFYKKEEYEVPNMEGLKEPNSYLCTKCCAAIIEPRIRGAIKPIGEGLYAPRIEAGVYHVQEF